MPTTTAFLPMSPADVAARGWNTLDFICVTGDAYVDHPSFGIAIIARLLEHLGFRVAVISQPVADEDFTRLGTPRLGFMVTGGNLDSMVLHYTAAKKPRRDDPYSPHNRVDRRPDRATTVYARTLRRLFPDSAIILGGLEASLRRFAHYDYWADAVLPSILEDSGADLLIYGMGERPLTELAQRLSAGEPIAQITDIRGTSCFVTPSLIPAGAVSLASSEKVAADKAVYQQVFMRQMKEQDPVTGRPLVQKQKTRLMLQNPPALPLSTEELDAVFALPFMRTWHPSYNAIGGIKAIEEVEFSLMHNRGCFGHCNFCAIALHQGRTVSSRSILSVLAEAEAMIKSPRFKGYIHDVGGPTANFRRPSCQMQQERGLCSDRKCLGWPTPCPALEVDHSDYVELLDRLRALPGVKKVFVRSGLRYDYMMLDPDPTFFDRLVEHHISGQLKVAPEHSSDAVLRRMGKPPIAVYRRFAERFYKATAKVGKKQYLVPYLISSHPGSRLSDAVDLALFIKEHRLHPEQVQDFYPTPGTISTCMFYTGIDPTDGQSVYIPRSEREKAWQRALLQYWQPRNHKLVVEALQAAERPDLIGRGPHCLVPPLPGAPRPEKSAGQKPPKRPNRHGKKPGRGRR